MMLPVEPAREALVEYLERRLVGPGFGEPHPEHGYEQELVEGRLSLAYMQGMLYPRQAQEDPALGGDDEGDDEDDEAGQERDNPLGMANALLPASMGLSFCIAQGAAYAIELSGAHYVRDPDTEIVAWRRVPLAPETVGEIAGKDIQAVPVLSGRATLGAISRPLAGGRILVTVSLSNALEGKASKAENILFQAGIKVSAGASPILPYPATDYMPPSEEEREIRVMYGQQRTFAVGHGISAGWDLGDDGQCTRAYTQALPRAHVWRPDSTTLEYSKDGRRETFGDDSLFRLDTLADDALDAGGLASRLDRFAAFYEGWIDAQPVGGVEAVFKADAARIVARCKRSASRIRDGARLLATDPVAHKAFKLANRAMLLSMANAKRASGRGRKDGRQGPFPLGEAEAGPVSFAGLEARWRPFQLAFMLQLMPSLVAENHPDRDLVDVIWFATGGGKTEAYLLASAFELVRRRLVHGKKGLGTAVINRYTYRFLTSDQFQRTAGMTCALELVRRDLEQAGDDTLGAAPFTIGLFAGEGVSPNRFTGRDRSAMQLLNELYESDHPREENPFPIEGCPCCGTLLIPERKMVLPDGAVDRAYYGFTGTTASFKINCPDEACDFHEEIPALIVDEQVYETPPSFLLGTIDKFAMVAWHDRAGRLFGAGTGTLGPSLIIQDELHLISGPLGTLAGVYEAGFEALVEVTSGARPKVIASTATIRNAAAQCRRIYGREGAVFPSPGIRADDSFFSRLETGNLANSRLYVGVMGQGLRSTIAMAWLMSATLQGVHELALDGRASVDEMDAYWTLVAYHNSKRELGRITNATRDEIPARVKVYASEEARERPSQFDVLELKAHSDTPIPLARQKLSRRHAPSSPALDIVPCTNIISVGIDIDRLGLMVVNGQPKLTAEYIQASSRVGRGKVPGLVIACYSPSKPRDRSHYEAFRDFHERFYSFVEPTSVTPGSFPAIERALHAAIVIAVRHGAGLGEVGDAGKFDPSAPRAVAAIGALRRRLLAAYPSPEDTEVRDRISDAIERRVAEWRDWAGEFPALMYRGAPNQQGQYLLVPYSDAPPGPAGWRTLQSMRHVDTELELKG